MVEMNQHAHIYGGKVKSYCTDIPDY